MWGNNTFKWNVDRNCERWKNGYSTLHHVPVFDKKQENFTICLYPILNCRKFSIESNFCHFHVDMNKTFVRGILKSLNVDQKGGRVELTRSFFV